MRRFAVVFRRSARSMTGARVRCVAGGFTLIEVMVALVIVAVALIAASQAGSALLNSAQRQSNMLMAQWCAENQFARLRLSASLPNEGTHSSECEQAGRVYALETEVTRSPNPNFLVVRTTVQDPEGYNALTLATIVGRY